MADSTPLKPCPFCGSDAIIREHASGCFTINCIKCDCKMPDGCYSDKFEKEAIEEWNKRA